MTARRARSRTLQRWIVLFLGAGALAVAAAGLSLYPKYLRRIALEGSDEIYVNDRPGGQSGTNDPAAVRRVAMATLRLLDACKKVRTDDGGSPAGKFTSISFLGKDGSVRYMLQAVDGDGEVSIETGEGKFTCPRDDWLRYREVIDGL
jgi:hypothetical protein